VASTGLRIGNMVRTLGYTTPGDGGGNDYEVVAAATGTDDGGSYIDLNTLQAKGLFPGGVYSAIQFGAVRDGVTDDTAAIQAAVASDPGSLYFPAGTYFCDMTVGGNIANLINTIQVHGDGRGSSIIKVDYAAATSGNVFNVTAPDVLIENLGIDVTCDNGGTVLVLLGVGAIGFKLKGCTLTGARSFTTQYWPHGIKLTDDSNASNVEITGNDIATLSFAFFSANPFGATGNIAKHWVMSHNTFRGCTNGVTFNSDFATSGAAIPWQNVTFSNNILSSMKGSMGGDSMNYLSITGNVVLGSNVGDSECAFHLENLGENIIISNNSIECVTGGGINVYPLSRNFAITGNTIEGALDRDDSDDPSTWSNPSTISAGIWLVNDTDGEPDNVTVTGNVITSMAIGIVATNFFDGPIIQGNHISLCNAGIKPQAQVGMNVSGNTIKKCKYMYDLTAFRGILGKNLGVDCAFLDYNKLDDWGVLGLQWQVENSGNITTLTTLNLALFTAPDRMDVNVNTYLERDTNAAHHQLLTSTITKDNTPAFTATRGYFLASSSVVLPTTPFSEGGGNLRADIYNGYGTTESASLSLDFDGIMMWS